MKFSTVLDIVQTHMYDDNAGQVIYDELLKYRDLDLQKGGAPVTLKFKLSDEQTRELLVPDDGPSLARDSELLKSLVEDTTDDDGSINLPFDSTTFDNMLKFYELSHTADTADIPEPPKPVPANFFQKDQPFFRFINGLSDDEVKNLYKFSKFLIYDQGKELTAAKLAVDILPKFEGEALANFIEVEYKPLKDKDGDIIKFGEGPELIPEPIVGDGKEQIEKYLREKNERRVDGVDGVSESKSSDDSVSESSTVESISSLEAEPGV